MQNSWTIWYECRTTGEKKSSQLSEGIENKCSYTSENRKVIEDERVDSDKAKIIHVERGNNKSVEIKKHHMDQSPRVSSSKNVHCYTPTCSPSNLYNSNLRFYLLNLHPNKSAHLPDIPTFGPLKNGLTSKNSIPVNNYIISWHP